MIALSIDGKTPDEVQLGDILSFRAQAPDRDDVEARFFLSQQGMRYLRPLRDWCPVAGGEPLFFHVEAPGRYELAAEWRTPDGQHGWNRLGFDTGDGKPLRERPEMLRLGDGLQLWTPSKWDAARLKSAEAGLWKELPSIVEPGMTVWDVGASIGVYALRFGQLVGPSGHVVCVEASPLCLYFLRLNLGNSGFDHYTIVPVAMLDESGRTRFSINYGNANLGATAHSAAYAVKPGHEIGVETVGFDAVRAGLDLPAPDVVKIDVEGVEAEVVRGMVGTFAAKPPILVLELHGLYATQATLDVLDAHGYRYRDPESGARFEDREAVCSRFGNAVFQLIATPAPCRS